MKVLVKIKNTVPGTGTHLGTVLIQMKREEEKKQKGVEIRKYPTWQGLKVGGTRVTSNISYSSL